MTIQEISKELNLHIDTFRDELTKYVVFTSTFIGNPRRPDIEPSVIVVGFMPVKQMSSGYRDDHTRKDIPIGFIKFEGTTLSELIEKVNHVKELLLDNGKS